MPNIMSAKKALRQSERKRAHNLFWKTRVKRVVKELKNLLATKGTSPDILKEKESLLQKYLDKAAKKNVIHKNKADRLKSRYAQKVTAYLKNSGKAKKTAGKSGGAGEKSKKAAEKASADSAK
ncbi:30S ribosomal protein S20 [candidate division WWE3 bacterium]|nr:30S ribosomal protein S20 [candidate division WWE3 bacterium]